ncbi:MAG: NAD(P)-dependent oxidoreductase [Ancrocorticia sp.]|jgi:dTDP-6-deoxy-L-talose 4-dehydrogenase (NAD+)|nr:NAD(P)-dependent oxidoreductase [Ancrocorticia sp.]
MHVLVTGANGYLGAGIVRHLCDLQCQVTAAATSFEHVDPRAIKAPGDVLSFEDPFAHYGRPDVVLHLAWRDGFRHQSKTHVDELPRHMDFIDRLVDAGLPQLAVMGSMHEVGYHEGEVDEHTPCEPLSPYGIAKNALRQYCRYRCADSDTILQWLRGFYIVGSDPRGSSIFSKLVEATNSGQTHFPFTTGRNKYDFLDYEDFCHLTVLTILQTELDGIINICSGHPLSLGERIRSFIRENDLDIELDYGAFPDRPYDSPEIWGDAAAIRSIATRQTQIASNFNALRALPQETVSSKMDRRLRGELS